MADSVRSSSEPAPETSGKWLGWVDYSLGKLVVSSLLVTIVAGLIQVSLGSYSMTIGEAWLALVEPATGQVQRVLAGEITPWTAVTGFTESLEATEQIIVWDVRLPRVLVAVFVGMNLAISGAIFQAVTRNELASPFILGVSSGAGLAILLTLVVFASLAVYLPLFAAIGGMAAFLLVYAIAWKGGTSPVRLVLAGVIVGTVFSSIQTALFLFAPDVGVVQNAIQWTTGSLVGADWEQVRLVLPWTVVAVGISLVASRQLNVLLLGEQTASALGMSVERVRFALASVAVLAAAASVAVAGIVSFVGLIVPHVVRSVVGSDYKRVIVGCLFVGPALMVVADVGARLALSPTQLPVGIITGLVGGPYFLYLMRKKRNLGEI
ncbi:FecCD family ABC transporter permease [Natrarchaeobius sp. A-rgal3]|uniref:FecCD family ABC transporter permease n=1 Tax=Natrarchaeobius versutus TaxID=1679078 RepID=UPI00350ECF98